MTFKGFFLPFMVMKNFILNLLVLQFLTHNPIFWFFLLGLQLFVGVLTESKDFQVS